MNEAKTVRESAHGAQQRYLVALALANAAIAATQAREREARRQGQVRSLGGMKP